MKNSVTILIGLYLGVSTIYWFPNTSTQIVTSVKYFLFVLTLLFSLHVILQTRKVHIPNGIYGPLGLCLIILVLMPSGLSSNKDILSGVLLGYLTSFIFFWSVYALCVLNKIDIKETYITALITLSVFVTIHVLSEPIALLNFTVIGLDNPYDTFQDVGFNLSRTGWSNGLALFLPTVFYLRKKFHRYTLLALIFYSQFLSGGRAGLLASLMVLVLLLNKDLPKYLKYFVFLVFTLLILLNTEIFLTSLRLERLDSGINYETLNSFSASRLDGYVHGIKVWMENPFFGAGMGEVDVTAIASAAEIHNFWVKILAESGIFAFIVLFLFMFGAVNIFFENKGDDSLLIPSTIIIAGAMETLFEPNVIFGSFQNSAIWWFTLSIMLYERRRRIYALD